MREDIFAALRNAQDRGQLLDDTIQSLINAGYSRQEVMEAARIMQGTVFASAPQGRVIQRTFSTIPKAITSTPLEFMPAPSQQQSQQAKPKRKILIIFTVSLILIAAAIASYLVIKFI